MTAMLQKAASGTGHLSTWHPLRSARANCRKAKHAQTNTGQYECIEVQIWGVSMHLRPRKYSGSPCREQRKVLVRGLESACLEQAQQLCNL